MYSDAVHTNHNISMDFKYNWNLNFKMQFKSDLCLSQDDTIQIIKSFYMNKTNFDHKNCSTQFQAIIHWIWVVFQCHIVILRPPQKIRDIADDEAKTCCSKNCTLGSWDMQRKCDIWSSAKHLSVLLNFTVLLAKKLIQSGMLAFNYKNVSPDCLPLVWVFYHK